MKYTKKRMTAQLPPTPCTPEMRAQVQEFAQRKGRSIADIQRESISLFLSSFDTNSVENVPLRVEKEKAL